MSINSTTLPNGLRVVTERMAGYSSAALGVWVMAGARHEHESENGIAHFLEHMAFKGTARRSARAIAEEIEDVGGMLNAYTGREMTAYYARVLGADLPRAADIIADILRAPAFAPDEIEVERGVILQEIGQSRDTPDDIIFDWLQEVAYPGQPIGRPILGLPERVHAVSRDDLARFTGANYAPGRMILAAAGDVDHDQVVRLAEAGFGDLSAAAPGAVTPARFTGGERREEKALEQAHMALAFDAPSRRDPAIYAAQLYATALGGGMSSRLFQELRENRGLCYTVFAQPSAWSDTGAITLYAGTGEADIATLARAMAGEIARTARDLTETELERARAQNRAGMLMGMESVSARAERLARMTAIWGRVPTLDEMIAKLDAVTLEEVRAMAARMAREAPAALALYGPVGAAPDLDGLRAGLAA